MKAILAMVIVSAMAASAFGQGDPRTVPELQHMEAVPLAQWHNPTVEHQLTFKGEAWDGPTTEFRGMVIADVYSMWQHPGKYTVGEWSTAGIAAIVAGYFAGEQFDVWGGGSSSPPSQSGTLVTINKDGLTIDAKGKGSVYGEFRDVDEDGNERTVIVEISEAE